MDSIVNYSSEEDRETDFGGRTGDIVGERSSKRKIGLQKKTNYDRKNYEDIDGMVDSSENSNISSGDNKNDDNHKDSSTRHKRNNNFKEQSQKRDKREVEKKRNSYSDDRHRSRYRESYSHREEKNSRQENNRNKERERERERDREREKVYELRRDRNHHNRDHDRNRGGRSNNKTYFRDGYNVTRRHHNNSNNSRNYDDYRPSREQSRSNRGDDCRERGGEKDKYRYQNRDYNDKSSDRSNINKESPFSNKNHRHQESHATKTENNKKDKDLSYVRSQQTQELDHHHHNQTVPSPSKSLQQTLLYKNELMSLSSSNKEDQKLLSSSSTSASLTTVTQHTNKAFSSINENKPEPTTITLPSYYNPNVINPNKYAEQVQKRKLLWSNKKVDDTTNKWGKPAFAQDTDGKVASKFMRLMGIKSATRTDDETTSVATPANSNTTNNESIKKREEMFSSMEQQYEVARQATHTMRGVGLGFGLQPRQF